MFRVFVYGSLLRGQCNHEWLQGARFVGEDRTAEPLTLVDLGEYPAVVDQPLGPIVGEVWEVDEEGLARLDILEDYPDLYLRRPVALASGGEAIVYMLRGTPELHRMRGTVVPDGDYRAWLASRG